MDAEAFAGLTIPPALPVADDVPELPVEEEPPCPEVAALPPVGVVALLASTTLTCSAVVLVNGAEEGRWLITFTEI